MTLEEASRQRGIQLPPAAPMRSQGASAPTRGPRLPDARREEDTLLRAADREAERAVANAAKAKTRLETENLTQAYQDRGIDITRDVAGRPVPIDSERNRAAGVTPARLLADGTADTTSFDESKVMALKPKPVESPEVIALRQTKSRMGEVAKYHASLVSDFDKGPGALLTFDTTTGTDGLGAELDALEADSADKVGTIKGALTPGVASGDASPKALAAQSRISDLVKQAHAIDPNVRDAAGVRSVRTALIDQRKRVAEQAGKAEAAKHAAELAYGAELSKAMGFNTEGITQPAMPEPVAAAAAQATASGIDPETVPQVSAWRRAIQDIPLALLSGAVGLGEAAVGIANIGTLGAAGNALELIGYKPQEARQIIAGWQTDALRVAKQKVAGVKGFVPTIEAMVQNPSTIVDMAAESAPSMIGGGGVGQVGARLAPAMLGRVAALLSKTGIKITAGMVAAGLGEGAITAGQQAEQTRQETGGLTAGQAAIAVGSGLATSAIGVAGGKIASRLGIGDIDTMLVEGKLAEKEAGLLKRVIGGAFSEGVLEELPQSAQEQVAQNIAQGKPWNEGVAEAAASGLIVGGIMGGGANIATAKPAEGGDAAQVQPETQTPPESAAPVPDDNDPFSPALDPELEAELAQSPAGMEEGQTAATEPAPATPAPGFSSAAPEAAPLSQEPPVGGVAAPTGNAEEQKPTPTGSTPQPAITTREPAGKTSAETQGVAGAAPVTEQAPAPVSTVQAPNAEKAGEAAKGKPGESPAGRSPLADDTDAKLANRAKMLRVQLGSKKATPEARARTEQKLAEIAAEQARRAPAATPSRPPAAESDQPQAPTAPTPAPAPRAGTTPRRGTVGGKLAAGEVVTTATGRATTPFPKIDTTNDRKAQNTVRRVDAWLYENAVAEARARQDNFVLRQFESENPAKMPPATKDSMEEYLFGDGPINPPNGPDVSLRPVNTSTPSPRPADVSKIEAKTDTSPAPASIVPRGQNTPAEFIKSIAAKTGIPGTDAPMRAVLDLSARLNRAAPDAFRQMEVYALSEAEWQANPATGRMTPESAAAYNPETNTLYLRTEKVKEPTMLVSALVHESGHFAERFALPEALIASEWAKLDDAQIENAAADYNPDDQRTAAAIRKDPRARSEWVAQQFARVVGGKAKTVPAGIRARLEAFFAAMKEFATKWLGSDFASSPAFDAEVLRVMGFSEEAEPSKKAPQQQPEAPFIPTEGAAESPGKPQVAASNETVAKTKPKGKKISIGLPANNESDLLNAIEQVGGAPNSNAKSGGEYDGFAEAFGTGVARLLVRGKKGEGRGGIDRTVAELADYGYRFDSIDAFYQAVIRAVANRKSLAKANGREDYERRFETAFLANENPRAYLRAGKPITVDDLGVDDEFTVNGEKFRVIDIDEEGNVTIKDGITKTLPPGTPVYPDKGEVKVAKRSTDFLSEEDATEPAAPPLELREPTAEEKRAAEEAKRQREQREAIKEKAAAPIRGDAGDQTKDMFGGGDMALFDAAQPGTPAPAPAPAKKSGKFKVSDDLRKGIDDLLGTPAMGEPTFTRKFGQKITAANNVIGMIVRDNPQITSRATLAEFINEVEPRLRPFSESLFSILSGAVDTVTDGPSDWNAIYSAIDAPVAEPANEKLAPANEKFAEIPEPQATAEAEIRTLILADENRGKKAIRMKQMADRRGIPLKDMQEQVEAMLVKMANEIASDQTATPKQIFDRLREIYDKQPLFSARTSTSVQNQAYSTPAPLSAAMANMTNSRRRAMYEPTAGTGMLMIGADLARSHANELNDLRAATLRDLRVGEVTQNDAPSYVPPKKFPRVHANPPFGTIANVNYDGFGIRKLEHLISLKALEAMEDGGNASIILGASMQPGDTSRGAQWVFENYLYSRYNVVDNFEVSGDLYANQGTKWPVRILTIAGRRSTPLTGELAPKTVDRLQTWDDVWARSEKTRNEVIRINEGMGAEGSARPAPAPESPSAPAPQPGRVHGSRSGNAGGLGGRGVTGGNQAGQQSPARPAAGGNVDQPAAPATQPQGDAAPVVSQPSPAGQPTGGLEGGTAGSAQATDDAQNRGGQVEAPADARELPQPTDVGERQFTYVPRSGGEPFGTLTPRNIGIGTHAALDALAARVGPIDNFVSGKLDMPVAQLRQVMSADQIDGVALAIAQIEGGGALIIGDETGIGKGRQAAGLIRYAKVQGKIPVFFTLDPKLFTDMNGDLKDIGTTIKPLIFGDSAKASIVNQTGEVLVKAPDPKGQKIAMKRVLDEGMERAGYDSIFITYSQINQPNERQKFLEKLGRESGGIVVIMDEAHSASGKGDESMQAAFMQGGTIKRGAGSEMKTIVVPGMLNLPAVKKGRGGVLYLSATYSKRPDNMPLYFRTDMAKAAKNFKSLVEAMTKGGVALQQAVSEALAASGQYLRRERDFAGINFNSKTVQVEDRAKLVRQMDDVTTILQEVIAFSRMVKSSVEAENEGERGTAMSDAQISATDFASIVHNQIGQLLLTAKADEVVREAIAARDRGEKPVITLMSTMESFMDNYVDDLGIKPGEEMTLSWKSLLTHALDRTLRISKKFPNGDREVYTVTPASLGLQSDYDAVLETIADVDVDFPVSPIDYITQRLQDAGIKIGELTGRESGIQYLPGSNTRGTYKRFKKANKNALVNGFNGGELDALLLNASGSTGLSIHAAPKFKDTRKRHMFIVQPALDINVVVQTLGRIKRTGMLPGSAEYTHLKLPLQAELRPAAVLNRKMKSLNANTTAEAESGVSIEAVDMLNKYGDAVVAQYLVDNPNIWLSVNMDADTNKDGTPKVEEDMAKTFMARLSLLPESTQSAVYAEIIPTYNALVEQLKATGEYDLDITVFDDWDGVMQEDQLLKQGTDERSLFTASVRSQKWEITDSRPSPTGEQMLAEFRENHGSKEQANTQFRNFLNTVDAEYRSRLQKSQADMRDAQARGDENGVIKAQRAVTNHLADIERWERTNGPIDRAFARIGETVTLRTKAADGTEESVEGMLVGVKLPDIQKDGLRVTPSRFQFRYMLNQPGGMRYQLSGAQLVTGQVLQTTSFKKPSDFKGSTAGSRYERYVITGNPIAAYEATGGRGKVVRFKSRDGQVITGVLMGQKWTPKELASDPRMELVTGKAVQRFLSSQPTWGNTIGVEVGGDLATIKRMRGSGYEISVPSSVRGRDYYLDGELRDLVGGDFRKSGNRMVGEISSYSATALSEAAERIATIAGQNMRASSQPSDQVRDMVQKANQSATLGTPAMGEDATSLNPPKGSAVPGTDGRERYRRRTDTEIERGYDAVRQTYEGTPNAETRKVAQAFLDAAGENAAMEAIFDKAAPLSDLVKSDVGNLLSDRLQNRIADAKNEPQRLSAVADYQRFSNQFAKRATELGQAVQVLNALDVFTRQGALTSATQGAQERQDKMLGPDGLNAEREIVDALNGENAKVIDALLKDVKADVRKVKVTKKMVERVTGELPKTKKELDAAIRDAFEETNRRISNILHTHHTQADAIGSNLADKLTQEAGLSQDEAEKLAEAVRLRLTALTETAKRKVIARLERNKGGIARRIFTKTIIDKVVDMSNSGAIDQPSLRQQVAEELKLPRVTDALAKRLKELTDKYQSTPEGQFRDRVATDILAEMRKVKGIGPIDVATAIYYSHILSGYTTQLVNIISTAFNVNADIANEVLRAEASAMFTRNGGKVGTATGQALTGMLDGARMGFTIARSIVDTGYAKRAFDAKLPEVSPILEILSKEPAAGAGGAALKGYATMLRYITRLMRASDAVFYRSASEAFQRVAAAKIVGAQGAMTREETNGKIRDLLGTGPAQYEAAVTQAKGEGFTGYELGLRVGELLEQGRKRDLVQTGDRKALEATFNSTPRGALGIIAKNVGETAQAIPALKLFVPFTNIVANVTNASLNYSPIGFVRAARGYAGEADMTQQQREKAGIPDLRDERAALNVRATAGTAAMVALLAYAMSGGDDDEAVPLITARGSRDANKNRQLRESGWAPYTIRIGNTRVSYLSFPTAVPLAFVGNIADGIRYNDLAKHDFASAFVQGTVGIASTLTEMSFLQGIADLFDTLRGKEGKTPERFAANVASSALVPNLVKQIDRTFDDTYRRGEGLGGEIAATVPGLRQNQPALLNNVGQEVGSQPLSRFGRTETGDPLWDTLNAKGVVLSELKSKKVGDRQATPEEIRVIVIESGPRIEKRLRAALPILRSAKAEAADKLVEKIALQERNRAAEMLPVLMRR